MRLRSQLERGAEEGLARQKEHDKVRRRENCSQ